MNKTVKKLVVAGLACVALCGTTMAAPHRGPAPHPARIHHAPPPPPPRHHHHTTVVHHYDGGLVTLGAALIGGIVGGLLVN